MWSRLAHLAPCALHTLYITAWPRFFYVGTDAGTSAGLSLPLAAAQWKPFADQLADASAYYSMFKLERQRLTRLLFPSQ